MIDIKLPFWLDGPQLAKLVNGGKDWWSKVESWLAWPGTQFDPLTCAVPLLVILAFQRDIVRFPGESLELFRRRVKFAYINASDSGFKAGFSRIFERIGIGYVDQQERFDEVNWDVIGLVLSNQQISDNPDLLMSIVLKYGRTCRRYTFTTIDELPVTTPAFSVGHVYSYDVATI